MAPWDMNPALVLLELVINGHVDCECLPTLTFFQEPDRSMKKKISIRKLLLIR